MTNQGVALVTGASRGMGASIAIDLAAAGYDVAIAARSIDAASRSPQSVAVIDDVHTTLATVADAIAAHGATAFPVRMDVTDLSSVAEAAGAVLDRFGRCDVLVNNAAYQGASGELRFLDTPIEDLAANLIGDVVAPGLLIQKLVPGMVERGRGTVVNMSSGVAFLEPTGPVGAGGWSLAYAAGKAGIDRFAGVLNQELAGTGVRVFNVEPGFTAGGARLVELLTRYPASKVTPPEAIGAAVRWLVTEPEAEALLPTRIHLPAVTQRHDLLPGWGGPGTPYPPTA